MQPPSGGTYSCLRPSTLRRLNSMRINATPQRVVAFRFRAMPSPLHAPVAVPLRVASQPVRAIRGLSLSYRIISKQYWSYPIRRSSVLDYSFPYPFGAHRGIALPIVSMRILGRSLPFAALPSPLISWPFLSLPYLRTPSLLHAVSAPCRHLRTMPSRFVSISLESLPFRFAASPVLPLRCHAAVRPCACLCRFAAVLFPAAPYRFVSVRIRVRSSRCASSSLDAYPFPSGASPVIFARINAFPYHIVTQPLVSTSIPFAALPVGSASSRIVSVGFVAPPFQIGAQPCFASPYLGGSARLESERIHVRSCPFVSSRRDAISTPSLFRPARL